MTALITIDVQEDFMPLPNSALGVPGAIEDTNRLVKFIQRTKLDAIFATQDSHYEKDISHTTWFDDHKGSPVVPYTKIKGDDLRNGKFVAKYDPVGTQAYLDALDTQKEFEHTVWPIHCQMGTKGHNFNPVFLEALNNWTHKTQKWPYYLVKGVHPMTEHYGAWRANIPNSDASTQVNQGLFQAFNNYDRIIFNGQARDFCVINSLKQMLEIAPQLADRIFVLEDCMSNVVGLTDDHYDYVDALYADAKQKGVTFVKSTDL